jgi:phosphatidate phosphatase PAH1
MKRIIIALLVLTLIMHVVFAQGQQGGQQSGTGQQQTGQETENETGQGQQVQTGQETQNQGEEENLMIQQREQLMARNATELRQMIQERKQEMNQEMQSLGEQQQKVYQNQNRLREAVHVLLAMENLTGGIGRNVSQIAREFNNSVQATIRAEERIQTRNMLIRFFFGGDEVAAGETEQEVNRNRLRIQELKRLMQECECDEEIRAMMQEQIQNMEQEQNRLQELAQNEKKSKGLFGWLWK